jgi:hypothetical protein
MSLPTTVKILHKQYDLIERTDPTDQLNESSYGNHYPVLLKIEWMKHKKSSENVDTIIHELLHAIIHTLGFKDLFKNEEEAVTKLALGLTTVMGDNKKLIEELLKML